MMMGVGNTFYYGGGGGSGGGGEEENGVGGPVGGGAGDENNYGLGPTAGEFQKVGSVLVDGGDRFGVSAVTFDIQEELIWMGNRGGHVTSYYGANMEKYTSFQVTANQEVRQILTFDDIILILSESQLRGQIRRGLPMFTHVSENLLNMQCMMQTSLTTVLMGGHQESIVEYDLSQNVETKTVHIGGTGCAILRGQGHNRICAGLTSGQVYFLDSRTYKKEQSIEAHSGSLSDLDVQGNLLVTCGFSNRHGSCSVDRFLKIYDLRVLRSLAPINVSIDPIMLRFLPSFSSRIAALSQQGQMEILETQALSSANIMIYQVTSNGSESRAFDVSSSCHHLAFGDETGTLNLFSSHPSSMFNPFSRGTEFADPVEQCPPLSFMDGPDLPGAGGCFSSIPLPFVATSGNETLASDWPSYLIQPGYRRHPEVEPSLLASMKLVGPIGYAPNPGSFRRNQMQYKFDSSLNNNKSSGGSGLTKQPLSPSSAFVMMGHGGSGGHRSPGKAPFSPPGTSPQSPISSRGHSSRLSHSHHSLHSGGSGGGPLQQQLGSSVAVHHVSLPHSTSSSRHHHPHSHPQHHSSSSAGGGGTSARHHSVSPHHAHNNKFHIPKRYARHEWKKSTFEPGDCMDASFNLTKLSGLEAITVNSYCNPLIQVLYHVDYLRGALISHLCKREACLSCELGFLFYMLDQSKTLRGLPCTPSNFLRAFRVVPEASALGLIRQENQAKQRSALYRLISNWNRFILHQIETETMDRAAENSCSSASSDEQSNIHNNAIAELFAMKQENVNSCGRCGKVLRKESVVLLSNLLHDVSGNSESNQGNFVTLLEKTLYPEQTTPAWCDVCKKYSTTFQSRAPKNLPNIVAVNTCLDGSNRDFEVWTAYMESQLIGSELNKSSSKTSSPSEMLAGGASSTATSSASPVTPTSSISLTNVSSAPGHLRSCRYGNACTRPDCKFWHEDRSPFAASGIAKTTEFDLNPDVQVKWLPSKLRISIGGNGRLSVVDLDTNPDPPPSENNPEDADSLNKSPPFVSDYELTSVVIYVKDPEAEDKHNLVSLIKVAPSYLERAGMIATEPLWFLFNDFSVKEVSASEALYFSPKWKFPSVVYYQKVPLPENLQTFPLLPSPVSVEVLQDLYLPKPKAKEVPGGGSKGSKLGMNPVAAAATSSPPYKPLGPEEIPGRGELVAIDAEFVTLGQEETELRSDGKLSTVKPQQLSLARVTCLRGQPGPLEGTPFLDDYISTQEVVVDYLTKFSGIQPGDLDINYSSKHLITLKSVYLKLRYLIDSGVKFVGHGLNNDFRVINLVVPSDQVIDTVNLFYLPSQRMVSLRFLAWHFLGMVIQSETHDSGEDARAALALFRKYEALVESGNLDKALEDLYEIGNRLQWKVNGSDK